MISPVCKALVLELDGEMLDEARKAWILLKEKFAIQYISQNSPCPHMTLASGIQADTDALVDCLRDVTSKFQPLEVEGNGIAVLVVESPVIFIRWKLTQAMTELRNKLQASLMDAQKIKYELCCDWLAKTSLAYEDSDYENLGEILKTLSALNFYQNMTCSKLGIYDYSDALGERKIDELSFDQS